MDNNLIRYTFVWSGLLRLSHWLIAIGVVFLLVSAWALTYPINFEFWYDWHIMAGQGVLLVVLLRIGLLFVPGSSHWRALVPQAEQQAAMWQMLKFYLSFARFPLPNWYAHNPLWIPIYTVFYIVLLGCLLTGMLYETMPILLNYPISHLHEMLANFILLFVVLHIIAMFLHDWKGKGAFISAMINGYRYFHVDQSPVKKQQAPVEVKLDSIGKQ